METGGIAILVFFVVGIVASLTINQVLLHFSRSLGIRNKNDVTVRWSNESKPSLGGISLFAVFIFAVMAIAVFCPDLQLFETSSFLGLLAGSCLAFVIGITDDAYNTRPLLKLLGQITCGALVVYSGQTIALFHIPELDAVFTVLWMVVIMNSLNMLDNMDGITGTVSFFVLLLCFISFTYLYGLLNTYQTLTITAVAGALIGFMYFNINPSKMFMGDTGSQFISFLVAFFAIELLWNYPANFEMPSWTGLILVLTIFTPAAVDTLSVVINRLKKGRSPMVGGKDHTTHHLVYKGLSDFSVWVVFLAISAVSLAIGLTILYFIQIELIYLTIIGVIYFIFVFFLLYRNTLKYKEPNE